MTTSSGATVSTLILYSTDIRGLSQFYATGLNLGEPVEQGGEHIGFVLGNLYLGFDAMPAGIERAPGAVIPWFEVDDLEATYARFVALGARVRYGPTRKSWGGYLAAVYDPGGNIVGLSQRDPRPAMSD